MFFSFIPGLNKVVLKYNLDVNECEGFLHGGCEDKCVNTVGSFRCECSGNTTLNSDGMSCAGMVLRAMIIHQLASICL